MTILSKVVLGTKLLIIGEIFASVYGLLVCKLIIGKSIKDYKTMLVLFYSITVKMILHLLYNG